MRYPLNYYLRKINPGHLPLAWVFFVGYKCNSACRHCFWEDLNKKCEELNLGEIDRISRGLGFFESLLVSGGEPTLRKDISDICHIFTGKNNVRNIHFPTNGLDPGKTAEVVEEILKKCNGVKLNVGLPLDGMEETNDYLRGVTGSFKKVTETAKRLSLLKKRFLNLQTYIITVVSNRNYDEIMQVCDYVKKLPVDAHGPSPMRGLPKDASLKSPTGAQWDNLINDLLNSDNLVFRKRTLKDRILANRTLSIYKSYSRIINGERVVRCLAGDLIGVIEPNGDVRLCELTPAIGNLRGADYDIEKVWFSEKADLQRAGLKDCACTHFCFLSPSKDIHIPLFIKSLFGY